MQTYRKQIREVGIATPLSNDEASALLKGYSLNKRENPNRVDLATQRGRVLGQALGIAAISFMAKFYDQIPGIPDIMRGHTADFFAVPAYMALSLATKALMPEILKPLRMESQSGYKKAYIFGLLGMYGIEAAQGLNLVPGTFDPGDLLAYTLGAALHYKVLNPVRPHRSH